MGLGAAALLGSCSKSEDTEPFVPAVEGATQPESGGAPLSEDEACERLLSAAVDAYEQLGCSPPTFPDCPGFVRPAGGSGCYEYSADSVEACEERYKAATDCRALSPCFATALPNGELSSCELVSGGGDGGAGGAGGAAGAGALGGAAGSGGAVAAGAGPVEGGAAGMGGQATAGEAAGGAAG